MGKSSPSPPDYVGAAYAQAEADREITEQQTWANRPTQHTPWGTTSWEPRPTFDPTTGQQLNKWTQTTRVGPGLQASLDSQVELQKRRSQLGSWLMGRAQNEFTQPMQWGALTTRAGVPQYEAPDARVNMSGGPTTYHMEDVDQIQAQQGPAALTRGDVANSGIPSYVAPTQQVTQPSQEGLVDIRRPDMTPAEQRQASEDAIYQRATSRLDPQYQQAESEMTAGLYAKGLRPGDAAYDREVDNFQRRKQDAYQTAMTESIMGGGAEAQRQQEMATQLGQFDIGQQEQQWGQNMDIGQFQQAMRQQQAQEGLQQYEQQAGKRGQIFQESQAIDKSQQDAYQQQMDARQQQFDSQMAIRKQQYMEAAQGRGLDQKAALANWQSQQSAAQSEFDNQMAAAGYQNQMRTAQMSEAMQRRNLTLNEINALISGQQVGMPDMPQFNTASRPQAPDLVGAMDMGYQAELGSANAQNQSMMQGLGSAASIAMMFSDRRLKRDIVQVSTTAGGYPWYVFNYIWGEPGQGVMADEVPADWTAVHPSGFLMVDYSRVN